MPKSSCEAATVPVTESSIWLKYFFIPPYYAVNTMEKLHLDFSTLQNKACWKDWWVCALASGTKERLWPRQNAVLLRRNKPVREQKPWVEGWLPSVSVHSPTLSLAPAPSMVPLLQEGLSQITRLRSVFICTHSLMDRPKTGAVEYWILVIIHPRQEKHRPSLLCVEILLENRLWMRLSRFPLTAKRWRTESWSQTAVGQIYGSDIREQTLEMRETE